MTTIFICGHCKAKYEGVILDLKALFQCPICERYNAIKYDPPTGEYFFILVNPKVFAAQILAAS